MGIPANKLNARLAILLVIALTFSVYANSLRNSFVFDDAWVITDNDFIKSWKNLPEIFSKSYLTLPDQLDYKGMRAIGSGELSYRPVVTLSYFIDYSLWKLKPFGYHLTNLLLHISNTVLLYVLLTLIVRDNAVSLLAALLFALHPVNSEAVNVIGFREDLLAFLFFISSFILFIMLRNSSGKHKLFCYISSLVTFALALFSKEMAITLPLVLILYDFYFVYNGRLRNILANFRSYYLGYIIVCFSYLYVWGYAIAGRHSAATFAGYKFYINVFKTFIVVATYIRWILIPMGIHLTIPDESSLIFNHFAINSFLSAALITIFIFIAIKTRKTAKGISFFIFYFFITLLPVSNIFALSDITACRYLYIPIIGFCAFISLFLFKLSGISFLRLSPKALKSYARDLAIIILAYFAISTAIRNLAWRNDISLWSEITEFYPGSGMAHAGLGVQLWKRGLLDEAIKEYKIAARLNPDRGGYHNGLGLCYAGKGMPDEAIKEYKIAIQLNPNSPGLYANLGFAYFAYKDKASLKEARACFKHALEIDVRYALAYEGLGDTFEKTGNLDEAKRAWRKALDIYPAYIRVQDKLKRLAK